MFSDNKKIIDEKCGGAFLFFLGKFSPRFQRIHVPHQQAGVNNILVSDIWKPLMPQEEPHGKELAGKPKIIFFLDPSVIKSDSKPVSNFYTNLSHTDCQSNDNLLFWKQVPF